ncbi:class I SAM-dependent methyltransferase [bacterium]|nr:MAG: class I SAM-dependent methyltransferase [bacterium]
MESPLRRLYRRASVYYDVLDWPLERFRYGRIRRELWSGLRGRILDLGAGTGRNVPHYPAAADVVAADASPEMLERARARVAAENRGGRIVLTDALALDFQDGEFDACVSTFLFCVLPDEVQERALREVMRVLRPGGTLYLLEYVYSRVWWRRLWMRVLAPGVEALYGARFDRDTRTHLLDAGFSLTEERYVHADIILKLVARKEQPLAR